MPVYQYEGLHYELPDGLSDEQAISKIKSHLGKPATEPKKAGLGTAIATSFANVGNMADTAISTLAGSAAALTGFEKDAVTIRDEMEARNKQRMEWANPDNEELSFGGKLVGGLATLPMQVAAMGLSPATTTKTMKDAGENNIKSTWAGMFDAAGNALSIAAPVSLASGIIGRGVTGGLIGAAQDAGTKALIQATADTEKGRAAFQPTWEDSAVAGVIGAGGGAMLGPKGTPSKPKAALDKIRAEAAAKEAAKPVEPPTPTVDMRGADLAGYDQVLREPGSFNPYDVGGYVSKSKKGVETTIDPEAQRTLFDEEIRPEEGPYMDQVREQEAADISQRAAQETIDARQAELEQSVLEARQQDEAITDVAHRKLPSADEVTSRMERPIGQRGFANKHTGAFNPEVFTFGMRAVTKKLSALTDRLANDPTWMAGIRKSFGGVEPLKNKDGTPIVLLHGTTADINGPLRGSNQGFHAGYGSDSHFFTQNAASYGSKAYLDSKNQRLNSQIHPVVIKGGNYPKLKADAGDWDPKEILNPNRQASQPIRDHITDALHRTGYNTSEVDGFFNYVRNQRGMAATNQAFTDVLKRAGIDGFFYQNKAESPKSGKLFKLMSQDGVSTRQKIVSQQAQHPESFVTWDNNNFKSVYDAPSTPNQSRTEKPIGQRGFANSQTGATTFFNFGKKDPDHIKVENSLAMSEDGTYIPNNPDTKVAIEKALEQGKDGKQWNMVQSGSTSVAMKTGSPIIKTASETVQNALKRADLLIRNSIFPAEQRIKNLSRDDITTLAEVFKDEMKLGKRYDGDILANNFSVKQIEAYTEMRKMFDDALDAQNAARLAKGQDPIKPMEAYMASRWQGDFRRPIYEKTKDGQKLVWYLADNTRGGLEKQTKALLKDFPDLIVDPKKDHVVRSSSTKTELESMYTKMLDILGRDDPAIQKLQKAIEEQEVVRGAGALGQEKHFEKKAGIRGFVGDRPGTSPRQEAIAMFQQQIQYAKNAYRWSELQKAADDIKTITSDPRLQEQQPNNVKYIREYFKNAVGMGEGTIARALDDSLRDGLGVSPTLVNNAVGDIKSFFILQKLAGSAGYTLANLVQTSNVIPYLAQMAGSGYRGNPATAVLNGTLQGMAMATWHYARAAGAGKDIPLPNQFMRDAFAYAEDNGVVARSVYDESPIQASFGVVGGGANLAAKTMTIPESFVRSVAFMTYANMLKSSGKFTDNGKMFQMAEEYVNKSMVDYRETERPLMFAKAGAAGNFANTLQTYPISFYNQYAYMAKQAIEGNPWGLGAMLAVHYGVAGLMGIPGFDDADKIYKWLRDNALPTGMWADVMKSPFMSDPKLWLMENAGKSAVYGALSENTGIGLTSRVAAPGAGAMLQSPAGPITDLAKQGWNLGKAVVDPTDKAKWAQVGMGSLPVGLQGLLETSDFMEDYTFVTRPDGKKVFMKTTDLADRKGGYARTPEEVQMRKFGLRSQKEVVERDVSYATSSNLLTQAKKSGELIDRYYSAVRQGNVEEAKKLSRLYIELTGKEEGIRDADIENQIKEEFMTDIERSKSAVNTVNKAKAIARMNAILEKR